MIHEGTFIGKESYNKEFRDGGSIPILGFGTGTDFKDRDTEASKSMIVAFKAGYRLFDTAQVGILYICPIFRIYLFYLKL